MTISTIMPTRNAEQYLEQSICSVLDQGIESELIIVDADSTDGTADIASMYADEGVQFIQADHVSPAVAMNLGLRKATGQIVGFLGSDDLYLPGTFEVVSRVMNGGHVDWVVGNC